MKTVKSTIAGKSKPDFAAIVSPLTDDEAQNGAINAVMASPAWGDKYYEDTEAVNDVFDDLGAKADKAGAVVVADWLWDQYQFDATPQLQDEIAGRARLKKALKMIRNMKGKLPPPKSR